VSLYTWELHRIATDLKWTAERAFKRDPGNIGAVYARLIAVAYLIPSTSSAKGDWSPEEATKWEELHKKWNTTANQLREARKRGISSR
jgi:hypothetical protein